MLYGLMLLLSLHCLTGETAQIRTDPSELTIGGYTPTTELIITCSPSSFGVQELLGLEIGKYFGPNNKQAIVHILKSSGTVSVLDPMLQPRIEYTGSLSGSSGSLELRIRELDCPDAAITYYCFESYIAATGIKQETATANITSRAYPERLRMTVTPDSLVYDMLPTVITFECRGNIGNRFDPNMVNFWVWEWRDLNSINPQWFRYNNVNNIQYFAPTPTGGSADCQYNSRSVLSHTVMEVNQAHEFRCYVLSPEYSANRTVYTKAEETSGCCGVSQVTLGAVLSLAVVVVIGSMKTN